VYVGQSLVRSYYVPNQAGNLWTVFRITPEGEFQDINTMQGLSIMDPVNVFNSVDSYLNAATRVEARSVSTAETDSAKSLNKQGEQAYHAGNIEEAIDLYRQAIDIDPNYGQAYSNLGLAHAKIGHTAEAIWANRKAIALADGSTAATVRASSYYNIARIYENAGQYTDALRQYESAKREKANPVYDKAIERVRGLAKN
jgi:tetratricopeptide (TPR) repeat protein